MTDDELEAAAVAWEAEHGPDRGGLRARFWRLNAEARERAEAERAGTSVWALRRAKTERREREARTRDARDLARARRALRPDGGPPPGDGLDLAGIRQALRDWDGPWPPTQDGLTEQSSRRVRQVLHANGTDWRTEIAAAERER
jgi:hypothetical protein